MTSKLELEISTLIEQNPVVTFKKGDFLIKEGASTQCCMFRINRGFVRTYASTNSGDILAINILKAGDYVYPIFLMDPSKSSVAFECITSVEAVKIPTEKVIEKISLDGKLAAFFHTYLHKDILDFFDRLPTLVLGNVQTKLAQFIIYLAKNFSIKEGNTYHIQVPLTHKDISTFLGSSRETVTVNLKQLQRKGLLTYDTGHLIIFDLNKIASYA